MGGNRTWKETPHSKTLYIELQRVWELGTLRMWGSTVLWWCANHYTTVLPYLCIDPWLYIEYLNKLLALLMVDNYASHIWKWILYVEKRIAQLFSNIIPSFSQSKIKCEISDSDKWPYLTLTTQHQQHLRKAHCFYSKTSGSGSPGNIWLDWCRRLIFLDIFFM